jgi:hypothetical protein
MSLLWEAAAEFVEIMAMRDVMADIGELTAEEFIEPFRGASIKKGMKFLAKNKVKSAGGASAVIGALGLPGAISAIDHHRKAARAGTARAAANGQSLSYMPSRPHRSFSLYRKSMAGKRKYMSPGHTLGIRPGYRGGKRRKVYRKQDATRFDAKARNYNARGSVSTNSGIAVVKKLSLAPNPTNTAAGGALDFIITNQKLKTVPDGQGGFSWNFSLSQFPQYTEYTDLYQWYKLLWVKITFYPEQNSYDSFESTGIQVGDTPTKIQGVSLLRKTRQSDISPMSVLEKRMAISRFREVRVHIDMARFDWTQPHAQERFRQLSNESEIRRNQRQVARWLSFN